MQPIVLLAGQTEFGSNRSSLFLSLRGPQNGWRWRNSMILASVAVSVVSGCEWCALD